MSNATPLRSFRLEDELWNEFKSRCDDERTNASKQLKQLIEDWLAGNYSHNSRPNQSNDRDKQSIQIEQDVVMTAIEAVKIESHDKYVHLQDAVNTAIEDVKTQSQDRYIQLENSINELKKVDEFLLLKERIELLEKKLVA